MRFDRQPLSEFSTLHFGTMHKQSRYGDLNVIDIRYRAGVRNDASTITKLPASFSVERRTVQDDFNMFTLHCNGNCCAFMHEPNDGCL